MTTLRKDIETDGRHAKVAFGTDWKTDAERRDFTINALYATVDGEVIDFVGGLADIETRTLRFIGDAEARIREDYLRILRFFASLPGMVRAVRKRQVCAPVRVSRMALISFRSNVSGRN